MTDQENHKELFFKPGVSPTSINQYYQSPAKFWKHSSLNPKREKTEPTEAMIFGRLVHCLVLQPEMFDSEFAIAPVKQKGDLDTMDEMKEALAPYIAAEGMKIKSNARKQDLIQFCRQYFPQRPIFEDRVAAFRQTLGRRTIVMQDQFEKAKQMQDAMFANRAVKQLIGNGVSEEPFCWWVHGNPIMRKCRMDYNRAGLVIEYKTSADPDKSAMERDIGNLGYHRQLAMQFEAATLKNGEQPKGAVLIVQDKELHDDIAIYALNAADISIGMEETAYAMEDIKTRLALMEAGNSEKQVWKKFPEQIQEIGLARWYKPKFMA